MQKIILLTVVLGLSASAGFFNNTEEAKKDKAEKTRLCKLFTAKTIKYEASMRDDRLAKITLDSYKKRTSIFCAEDEPIKVKVETKQLTVTKKIFQEDARLCKIFKSKITDYKKEMRDDALATTTLASYERRASIFCSSKPLESKEKEVQEEDKRLCMVFNEGPRLCKIFNKKAFEYEKDMRDDKLAKITLDSYKKRANIFCSKEELKEKDKKVYLEHQRLCEVFNNKVTIYQKDMRDDRLARVTLDSYKKRADYFCSKPKEQK